MACIILFPGCEPVRLKCVYSIASECKLFKPRPHCDSEPSTIMSGLQRSLFKWASRDSSAETLPLEMTDGRERPPISRTASIDLYDMKTDPAELASRPWKNSAKFFQNAVISTLALTKMSVHAKRGGSIEVMGMLTGKIIGQSIIVCDVYPLPVEGTETRVNAQNEAYEYMVQYLELLKSVGREEHIVGWYHSHPGYGCWLSGIDVATQSLNQNFQDPYLAIVVDPVRTSHHRKVDIGAFRAYPPGHASTDKLDLISKVMPRMAKSKKQDYGTHANDYYPLDISFYKAVYDESFIDLILDKSWVTKLLIPVEGQKDYQSQVSISIQQILRSPFEGQGAVETKEWKHLHELCENLIARRLEKSGCKNFPTELIVDCSPEDMRDDKSLQAGLDTDEELRNGEGYNDDQDDEDDDDDRDDDFDDYGDNGNAEYDSEYNEDEENRQLPSSEMQLNAHLNISHGTTPLGSKNTERNLAGGNETPTERRHSAAAGQKRGFRASSSDSWNRVSIGLRRKRLALSEAEGAFSDQFVHTQADIKANREMMRNVAKAEYLQFLTSCIQRRVFQGL